MADDLGERAKAILSVLVKEYITTGEPIGSSQVTRKSELDVSTATVRNVMAELESLGLLEKPHASAGRIPTGRGFRFYCDALLQLKEPQAQEREWIAHGLGGGGAEEKLTEASRLLHLLTKYAGVVLTPKPNSIVLERFEFVRLRDNRVLAILVGQNGQVQNKLVELEFSLSPDELLKAANYLNEHLRQVPVEQLRGRILAELENERNQYDQLANKALQLGAAATNLSTTERVLIEGTGALMESPDFSDVQRMRSLVRALDEKKKLLDLLDRVQQAREMQIFIGSESEFSSSAGEVSVIATPYGTQDAVFGTLGVIGPTRMPYERIIPLVKLTAQLLSRSLEE